MRGDTRIGVEVVRTKEVAAEVTRDMRRDMDSQTELCR